MWTVAAAMSETAEVLDPQAFSRVANGLEQFSKGSGMTGNHSSTVLFYDRERTHILCSLSAAWCQVQERWNEDLTAIEESIRLMLGNRLQEAEDGL